METEESFTKKFVDVAPVPTNAGYTYLYAAKKRKFKLRTPSPITSLRDRVGDVEIAGHEAIGSGDWRFLNLSRLVQGKGPF